MPSFKAILKTEVSLLVRESAHAQHTDLHSVRHLARSHALVYRKILCACLFHIPLQLPCVIRLRLDSSSGDVAKKLKTALLFFRHRKKRNVKLRALAMLDLIALRVAHNRNAIFFAVHPE
jgi:hypothetical protein